jgi:hypothetical protein
MMPRTLLLALMLAGATPLFATEPPAAPSATPIKHNTLKGCNQKADAKKLTGAARAQFVKDCQAPRPS